MPYLRTTRRRGRLGQYETSYITPSGATVFQALTPPTSQTTYKTVCVNVTVPDATPTPKPKILPPKPTPKPVTPKPPAPKPIVKPKPPVIKVTPLPVVKIVPPKPIPIVRAPLYSGWHNAGPLNAAISHLRGLGALGRTEKVCYQVPTTTVTQTIPAAPVQPATPAATAAADTGSTISDYLANVPTWAWLAGGGVGAYFLFFKKKGRR